MAFFNSARRPTSPPIPSYDDATSAANPLLGSQVGTSASFNHSSSYQPPTVRSARGSEDSLQDYRRSDDDDLTSLEESDSGLGAHPGRSRDLDDLDYQNDGIELDELHNGDSTWRRHSRWKGRWGTLRQRVDRWTQYWSWNRSKWLFSCLPRLRWPGIPESFRNSGSVICRFIGLLILIASGYALFAFAIFPAAQNEIASMFDPEGVRQYAQGAVNVDRIRDFFRHATSFDHVAGTRGSFYLAEWMQDIFLKAGLDSVHLDRYDVYLNYPRTDGRRVAVINPPEYRWTAKLEEESVYSIQDSGKTNTRVFHGHSRSGNASGPLIYFNYGSRADYKYVCSDSGIKCNGSIALVRYHQTHSGPALKVKAAEEWDIKGVLIYSDPAEDGFLKGKVWPEGRWRPDDSVKRDSVALTPWVLGDPLTPGHASAPGASRLPLENNPGLVNIPSLPLAWRDAQKLLQSLNGHGQKVSQDWQGGVPDVEWWTGDDKSPVVLLQNDLDAVVDQKVYNVMGKIEGLESTHRAVIVGNHRDSWCFGAADPGSGTAVMLEVVSILGKLKTQGWQPLRDIIFASWDAGEYNMIGSTEFVEDHLEQLRARAIGYINVGAGVYGPTFKASGSPLFRRPLTRVLDRVADPIRNKTFKEIWNEERISLEGLRYDSDYVAFQSLAGTTSINIGFEGEGYPRHSCYETFEWMERFGDPGLKYHQVLAQIWVLLILELSQNLILPLGMVDYAEAINEYINQLVKDAESKGAPITKASDGVDFKPLHEAGRTLSSSARVIDEWESWWVGKVYGSGAVETNALAAARRAHNILITDFDSDLLDIPRPGNERGPHGVPGREQFKHVVFGPQLWSANGEGGFPFVRDAIEAGDWNGMQDAIDKTARIITAAAEKLRNHEW